MNYRLLAAALILALYAVLAIALLVCSIWWDPSDTQWTHALTIFSAFGAMATAAASVLLGVEVQQTNVTEARESAQAATSALAALRETHRIAFATANGATGVVSAASASAEDRLNQVRTLLADAAFSAPARSTP